MVDNETWRGLTKTERLEFSSHLAAFIEAVQCSGARDGYEFGEMYSVYCQKGHHYLASDDDQEPFAGITSPSRAVIIALLADAVQNHNR